MAKYPLHLDITRQSSVKGKDGGTKWLVDKSPSSSLRYSPNIWFESSVTEEQKTEVRRLFDDALLQSQAFLCATQLCKWLKSRNEIAPATTAANVTPGAPSAASGKTKSAASGEAAEAAAATLAELERLLTLQSTLNRADGVFVLVFAAVKASASDADRSEDWKGCKASKEAQRWLVRSPAGSLVGCLNEHKLALKALIGEDEELQRQLIATVGWLVAVREPKLSHTFADILKWLYDEELLDEQPLFDWNVKTKRYARSVLTWINHEALDVLLGGSAPLLAWLDEAEAEEIKEVIEEMEAEAATTSSSNPLRDDYRSDLQFKESSHHRSIGDTDSIESIENIDNIGVHDKIHLCLHAVSLCA